MNSMWFNVKAAGMVAIRWNSMRGTASVNVAMVTRLFAHGIVGPHTTLQCESCQLDNRRPTLSVGAIKDLEVRFLHCIAFSAK